MKLNNILTENVRPGSQQYRKGLRVAAETVVKEAEMEMRDLWKTEKEVGDYKTRKEFFEAELQEMCDKMLEEFSQQLFEEIDVVLASKHGI